MPQASHALGVMRGLDPRIHEAVQRLEHPTIELNQT